MFSYNVLCDYDSVGIVFLAKFINHSTLDGVEGGGKREGNTLSRFVGRKEDEKWHDLSKKPFSCQRIKMKGLQQVRFESDRYKPIWIIRCLQMCRIAQYRLQNICYSVIKTIRISFYTKFYFSHCSTFNTLHFFKYNIL